MLKDVRQRTPSLHSSSAALQLALFPRRALVQSSGDQETPLDCLVLVASRAYTCCPTRLDMFAYFKTCCLRVWLPISLDLDADWDPPRWILTGLAQPQLLGDIKNTTACLKNHKDSRDNREPGQVWMISFISYTRQFFQDWRFRLIQGNRHRVEQNEGTKEYIPNERSHGGGAGVSILVFQNHQQNAFLGWGIILHK